MTAEFNEIVVPVDGSESAQRAATFGARLARATSTPLKLIYVFQVPPGEIVSLARLSQEDIDRAKKEAAREVFEQTRKALGDTGQQIEEAVHFGDPAEEIIYYLESHPDAMVVMGRRGLSRMSSLLLGSVSEKVVHHAAGSVTIVH